MRSFSCFGYSFEKYSKQEIKEYLQLIAENSMMFESEWSSSDIANITDLILCYKIVGCKCSHFIKSIPTLKSEFHNPNVWIEDSIKFIFSYVYDFLKEKCIVNGTRESVYEAFRQWILDISIKNFYNFKLNEFSMEFFSKNFRKLI